MIVDLAQGSTQLELTADVCIVGTGPAGLSLAMRLSQADPKLAIILLESGSMEFERDTQTLYDGASQGMPYPDLKQTRLRYFGGSTGHWEGWCTPLLRDDLEPRPWLENSGWPIDYDSLARYFDSAATFLQIPAGAWAENLPSISSNANDEAGVGTVRCIDWQFRIPPVRIGSHYRQWFEERHQVQVFLHANVTAINLDEQGSRVMSVSATTLGHTHTARCAARAFVLSCGGIENPRLLLASSSVRREGIGNEHDNVGRYFMDHIQSEVGTIHGVDPGFVERHFRRRSDANLFAKSGFVPKAHRQEVARCGTGVAYFTRRIRAVNNDGLHALRELLDNRTRQSVAGRMATFYQLMRHHDSAIAALAIKLRKGNLTPLIDHGSTRVAALCEQLPDRNNRISLSDRVDSLGNRLPQVHWTLAERDYHTVRNTAIEFGSSLLEHGLGRLQLDEWLVSEQVGWPDYQLASHHPMGTTRMAERAEDGVVDANCRVFGCDNLFVAGSSVFTTGGYANPTMSIVALSHRLSDHLAAQLMANRGL